MACQSLPMMWSKQPAARSSSAPHSAEETPPCISEDHSGMGTCSFAKVPYKSQNLCDNFCKGMAATYYAVCIYTLTGFSVPSLPNTHTLHGNLSRMRRHDLALLVFVPRIPMPSPFFGHGVRPAAMQHTQVEVFLRGKIRHAGDKRLPERPIIGPSSKDFGDGRIVNGRFPMRVFLFGQPLPLHTRIQDPQDEMQDTMIAYFALRSPLGHGEVREEKCRELRRGELDGNRRRCRLVCRCTYQVRTSCEAWGCILKNLATSNPTRG